MRLCHAFTLCLIRAGYVYVTVVVVVVGYFNDTSIINVMFVRPPKPKPAAEVYDFTFPTVLAVAISCECEQNSDMSRSS